MSKPADDTPAVDFEPAAGGDLEERRAQYARLRAETPVAWTRDGNGEEYWSVMGYGEISAAAKAVETFANGQHRRLGSRRLPLESDPPEHSAMRRLLLPFVSIAAIQALRPRIGRLVEALLQPWINSGGGDFARDIARPLPAQALLEWMGEPTLDWEKIKLWSDEVLPRTFVDAEDQARYQAGNASLWDYSRDLVARRADQKAVAPGADPIAALLAAGVDPETTAGVVRLLVSAGHDSTSLALGVCVHFLASQPEAQARLRAEPGGLRCAIDEILRLNTPVVAMPRTATQDIQFCGRDIRRGDRVLLTWASANLDEAVFEDPMRCRLDRAPNPHMTFGSGIHTCLGAPLARLELRLALEHLLSSSRAFGLSGAPEPMRMNHYGFDRLPLWVEPQT